MLLQALNVYFTCKLLYDRHPDEGGQGDLFELGLGPGLLRHVDDHPVELVEVQRLLHVAHRIFTEDDLNLGRTAGRQRKQAVCGKCRMTCTMMSSPVM